GPQQVARGCIVVNEEDSPGGRAVCQFVQLLHEPGSVDRLRMERISSQGQGFVAIVHNGDDNDRNSRRSGMVLQLLEQLPRMLSSQQYVQNNRGWPHRSQDFASLLERSRRNDLEARALENPLIDEHLLAVIFHNKYRQSANPARLFKLQRIKRFGFTGKANGNTRKKRGPFAELAFYVYVAAKHLRELAR